MQSCHTISTHLYHLVPLKNQIECFVKEHVMFGKHNTPWSRIWSVTSSQYFIADIIAP